MIVPAYGRPQFLRELLQSVRAAHARESVEVIVVDDGSPEPIPQSLADEFADCSIRFVRQDNAGTAMARNFGASLARGEYLLFIDDDDLVPSGSLTWRAEVLDADLSLVGIAGRCSFIRDGGPVEIEPQRWHGAVTRWDVLIHNRFYSPGQVLIRRTAFERTNGFPRDRTGSDDWALWIALTRDGPIFFDDRIGLGYRLHGGNFSRNVVTMYHGAVDVSKDAVASLCDRHAAVASFLSMSFIAGVYASKLADAATEARLQRSPGLSIRLGTVRTQLFARSLFSRILAKLAIIRHYGRFRMRDDELKNLARNCTRCAGISRARLHMEIPSAVEAAAP